jgi:amino acid transporter/mannitol/fructose-specific phosphotransferase system IIA component (Ntr-type)
MKLKKELNLLDVFCIASGAMISSGIFILPGLAHARAGPAVVVSYLIAGLLAMTGMLSQAELVSAMPKAGGDYFYVTRSMGPAVGTVGGLMTWFSLSLKSAFALVGMAAFTTLVPFLNVNVHVIAILLCVVFIVVNLVGIKRAGRTQVVLVIALLALMFLYVAGGLPAVRLENYGGFASKGIGTIFSTAGFVFVSYGGLLKVAAVAEEVKNPGRTIPLGMIFSLLVVTLAYIAVVFVTTGVLGSQELDNSLTPISDGAAAFMGGWGRIILSVAAMLAFISTANAGIMAASRYPLALSRDGLLPEQLRKISKRFKTPHVSIMITGAFMIAVLFLKLDILVKAASTVLILSYLFSCLSVIILREGRLQNYQPNFRAPLYPWIQIVGAIGFVFLLFEMGKIALFVGLILIAGGFFIYWFYGRIRATREYALLYLIERVTAKELTTRSLEGELKEIIRERDVIVKDRFDGVIEQCAVIDAEKAITMDEFFRLAAEAISPRIDVAQDVVKQKLVAREKESTTVIGPGLAIPHIIVDGEHKFDILLARCRDGIFFSEEAPNVHAVFVLAGSRDERNFHLRALASIAQIVQDPAFDKKWLAAKSREALRDLVLLGKRWREV